MQHSVNQLILAQGEATQDGHRPADAETEANKQRRKVQNRKNQRAHREYVPRYHSPCCAQKSLQDCGSRIKTRGLRDRAHSRSDAGASTRPTIVPPKKARWHQRAQQPRTSPLSHHPRTQKYYLPQPSVPSSSELHHPSPTFTHP